MHDRGGRSPFAALALALTLAGSAAAFAQEIPPASVTPPPQSGSSGASVGDLLVAPTRILFDGNRRSSEVTLVNIGANTATYRISLTHLRMTPEGELVEIPEATSADRIADELVRFSPRQVTLEPGVAQTVRIQLRKPAELEAGEYRSHLLFRAVPPPELLTSIENERTETESGLSIRLIPIYGVSIPLIVRHGETGANASISDVRLAGVPEGTPPTVTFKLHREGNQSVYGNLRVSFRPRSGPEAVLGMIGGVAVYTPLAYREVQIPLQVQEGTILSGGSLRVVYTSDGVGEELIADGEAVIP